MKTIRNLLVASSLVFGLNGSAQTDSTSNYNPQSYDNQTVRIDESAHDVFLSTPYGESLTEDMIKNNPEKIDVKKLSRNELELLYLEVATDYKMMSVKYGNVKPKMESLVREKEMYKRNLEDKEKEAQEFKDKYTACKKENAPKKDEKKKDSKK